MAAPEGRSAPWDPAAFDGGRFLRHALLFARALRRAGLHADLPAVLDFTRALDLVAIGDRAAVKAAGAALFVRRHEDLEPYGIIFDRFWRRHHRQFETPPEENAPPDEGAPSVDAEGREGRRELTARLAEREEAAGDDASGDLAPSPMAWSASEALRHREFERMTPAELREAARLIDRMAPRLEQRRTRRWELHPHGSLLAPRAMFRRNLAIGGDPLAWVWRRRVRRPRSLVVICDISGSMERHSRLLLRFAQALTRSRVHTEAFVFGTRLTRVTRQLRGRDPDQALDRVASSVVDWSGGTRIGHSFHEFNQHWARRTLRTSGVVIVVSDGWDRGDPALVAHETARLRRGCHRLIWLNPLAGSADYRPLAAGMAAAYPFLDDFLPAHDLASLDGLTAALGTSRGPRAAGRPGRSILAAEASERPQRLPTPGRTGPGLAGLVTRRPEGAA